jgi:flagellar M-ring protein FliF
VGLDQLLPRLKTAAGALTPRQQVSLVLAFAAVVTLVAGSAYWLNAPEYRLLFADLEPDAAADVVGRLKTQKIPYQLDPGGRAVRVPASRVDELRLEFTSQGMPSSGRIGFEIFDRTVFGATEFLEQINYRRALEGELGRTIATLTEVSAARVHIAMAKPSLFTDREQAAKASVVLKLKAGHPLATATVAGIQGLVSGAVEGLRPESVVILDTAGRPLARMSDPATASEPLGPEQMERQQRIEHDLETRVVALLEPVVGRDRVRVNVAARLDPTSAEETEERWDPETAVVRSRQASGEGTAASGAAGLSGARANLPTRPAADGTDAAAATASAVLMPGSRSSETTNYEISRTTRHTVIPHGAVARLSVAVLVDHNQTAVTGKDGRTVHSSAPRSAQELQKIQALVTAAVGLDAERGDLLTVENVPFDAPVEEAPVTPGFWQRHADRIMQGVRMLALVIIVLAVLLLGVRPLLQRIAVVQPAAAASPVTISEGPLPRTVADLEGEIEAQLDAAVAQKALGHPKMPVLTKRVTTMSAKEPEHAARLLRAWLTEDPR